VVKNLNNKLNRSDIELINKKIAQQGKSTQVTAYAYAVIHVYLKRMEERFMTRGISLEYEQAFEEEFKPLFEKAGWIAKWEGIGENRERKKWMSVVADKDAEIARLRAELESKK